MTRSTRTARLGDPVGGGGPAPAAVKLLDAVAGCLAAEPARSWREGSTLAWWGAAVPLDFAATPGGITATVTLVDDVRADEAIVLEVLAALNRRTSTGALALASGTGQVLMFVTHHGHERLDAFVDLALLMYDAALQHLADGLAEALDGTAAVREHPRHGILPGRDRRIDAVRAGFVAAGRRRSGFTGLARIAEQLVARGMHAVGSDGSLTAQLPWTSPVPVVVGRAQGRAAQGTTAVLRMAAATHPHLGNGLRTEVDIREHQPRAATLRAANDLNLAERDSAVPSGGAWTADGEVTSRLVHTSFLPNGLATPGAAADEAAHAQARVRWAQERLLPPAVLQRLRAGQHGSPHVVDLDDAVLRAAR